MNEGMLRKRCNPIPVSLEYQQINGEVFEKCISVFYSEDILLIILGNELIRFIGSI